MIFPRNFGYVSGGFFHASGSLLDSFGHRFRELSVVIGSGRNGTPACTGATFSVFQAVRNLVFSGIAFEGARGDDFFNFSASFGLRWGSRRLHFGHHGALIRRRNFGWIFGAKMMVFWDLPPTRKTVPVGGDGLAREEKIYFGHDIGTMLRES